MHSFEPQHLLAAVCVWTCICHGQDARSMFDVKILISKLAPIYTVSTSAIVPLKVATLNDKVFDNAMECTPLVAKSLLPGCCNPHQKRV